MNKDYCGSQLLLPGLRSVSRLRALRRSILLDSTVYRNKKVPSVTSVRQLICTCRRLSMGKTLLPGF
jgi:hypothetical protein